MVERLGKMERDRAFELAVVLSWDELVDSGESASMHVKYENVPELPLNSVEVWMIKNRGYGFLVCRRSAAPSNSLAPRLEALATHFANSYRSNTLAANLDFIMRSQRQFSRPMNRSIHGFVRIDRPSNDEEQSAIA